MCWRLLSLPLHPCSPICTRDTAMPCYTVMPQCPMSAKIRQQLNLSLKFSWQSRTVVLVFLNTAPLAHLLSPERTRRSGLSDSGGGSVKLSSSKGGGCDLQRHESREVEKKKERDRKAWNSETRLLHLGSNIVWETASQERSRNPGSAQTGNISVEYTYF